MMTAVFDDHRCDLGEGPLWHPKRQELFWFDITNNRMFARSIEGPTRIWDFDEMHSAAGWVSQAELVVASETGLWILNLEHDTRRLLSPLEADNPVTRSNDGRADPQGGFWIGTMGKSAQPGAGAIWRWYRGELRCLFPEITISNAICFSPDGSYAHFTDTVTKQVMKVALDAQGWPTGTPQVFLDLTTEGRNPDGAVLDADGLLWLAEWGSARVAAYDGNGRLGRTVSFAAPHTSCPAFGGPDLTTLFCTTAQEGMDDAARAASPQAGMTFAAAGIARGQAEHRVIL
ncbi:SMP-30/gluconolactonase/LRE family protein [Phaeobacter italicus]|uniref:SMP-30/gluconolactonase/LRE family protein n=1 Tax=Phaeobacter italicus TaxID=481446 RepID=UPI0031EE6426